MTDRLVVIKRDGAAHVVRFSPGDWPWICAARWHVSSRGYVRTTAAGRVLYLHRVVLNAPAGKQVDHINGDKLDNRRENLRVCTGSQNMANNPAQKNSASGIKGVYRHSQCNRWAAQITHQGQRFHLGLYRTPDEAAEAYGRAAALLFGEFARTASPTGDRDETAKLRKRLAHDKKRDHAKQLGFFMPEGPTDADQT